MPAHSVNTYLDWAGIDHVLDRPPEDGVAPRFLDLIRHAIAEACTTGMSLALKSGLALLPPIPVRYFHGLPRHAPWNECLWQGAPFG